MKILFIQFCLLYLLASKVESKPQITRLFPIKQETTDPQQPNETKPLDKLLGKLRATYNFVFRKPENESNVEKISVKYASDSMSNVEARKLIWSNRMQQNSNDKNNDIKEPERTYLTAEADDNWVNDIQPLDRLEPLELDVPLEPLEPLDLEDTGETESDKNREVEIIMPPKTNFQFPVTLSRHFVDWLGTLLGITYGAYSKLARIICSNSTNIRVT